MYPSSKIRKEETVCLTNGKNFFSNGEVVISDKCRCNLELYETAVWDLERLINPCVDSKRLAQMKEHQNVFNKVKMLYPSVAPGGLRFLYKSYSYSYYDDLEKSVNMQLTKPVCICLHELGHAYNHVYSAENVADEILAWDTAKSLALEIGYEWTDLDEEWLVKSLASYGLSV
jgi:hypothetical protein